MKYSVAEGGVSGMAAKPQRLVTERTATSEHFLDQVDYMVNLIGVEGVGLGLGTPSHWSHDPDLVLGESWKKTFPEFAGKGADVPEEDCEGLDTSERLLPNLTRGLVAARGYEDDEFKKILGGLLASLQGRLRQLT